jgi:hypothetical protein
MHSLCGGQLTCGCFGDLIRWGSSGSRQPSLERFVGLRDTWRVHGKDGSWVSFSYPSKRLAIPQCNFKRPLKPSLVVVGAAALFSAE